MTIVVTQVFRYENGEPKRIELTLFSWQGKPIETRFIDIDEGVVLIPSWSLLKAGMKLVLTILK